MATASPWVAMTLNLATAWDTARHAAPPQHSQMAEGAWYQVKEGKLGLLSHHPPGWESLQQVSMWAWTFLSPWPQTALAAFSHHIWKPEHPRTRGESMPSARLTREIERGTLKSLPPCSRKPQGAGPSSTILKESMVPVPVREKESVSGTADWQAGPDLVTSVGLVPRRHGQMLCTHRHWEAGILSGLAGFLAGR